MNVILTHNMKSENVSKRKVFNNAFKYMKNGISRTEAFRKSWKEAKGLYEVKFCTDATPEDVAWTIHTCCENGIIRTDLLRKWDSNMIQHPLDWVSYHLRRNGFSVEDYNSEDNSIEHNVPVYFRN